MAERLLTLLPPVIRDYKEIKAVLNSQEEEIDRLWEAVKEAEQEQFIESATPYGVKRWENILNLTPERGTGLEERKQAILTQFNFKLPYTMGRLVETLNEICGEEFYVLEMAPGSYLLAFKLLEDRQEALPLARNIFESYLPANLVYRMDLHHNPQIFQNIFALRFPDLQVAFGAENALAQSFQELAVGLRLRMENRADIADIVWHTAHKTGNLLDFGKFSVAGAFHNFGYAVPLDGSRLLDGSWTLDQWIAKRLPFPDFQIANRFRNQFRQGVPDMGALTSVHLANKYLFDDMQIFLPVTSYLPAGTGGQSFPLPTFSLKTGFENQTAWGIPNFQMADRYVNRTDRQFSDLRFSGALELKTAVHQKNFITNVSVANASSLKAVSLTKDSMYYLDGSVLLDGSRNLYTVIIEEEI